MNYRVPVIILKDLVILPNQEIKLELNNLLTKLTIKESNQNFQGNVLVVAPLDSLEEEPDVTDLPKVGVIAQIKNKISIDDSVQVRIKGVRRVAVDHYYKTSDSDILYSEVMVFDLPSLIPEQETTLVNKLYSVLEDYIDRNKELSNDILGYVKENNDLDKVTDTIASFLPFKVNKKMEYMQNINPVNRAKSLIKDMTEDLKEKDLDEELDTLVSDNLVKDQREYLLKEKLKAIKDELGENSWKEEETKELYAKIDELKLDSKTKDHIIHELNKYEIMNESSPEISVLRSYLDWVVNLPWNKKSRETADYKKVMEDLNKTHYGLDSIKERIAEYVAIKKLNKNIKSPIICLVGPPGVGKTSIAMSIAKALNRKFYKISVGGLNDSTELIGSRRTYLASNPGKIIQGINKCGTNNPVLLIDEVDKMVKDYKGDPASTLLEILDQVQNKYFIDNYIEVPFDLSNVLFILTANDLNDIPYTLIDRVEVITINSYTIFEKKDIAKEYILPRVIEENTLSKNTKFSDEIIYYIIDHYTDEAGVRDLERVLNSLARKMAINDINSINKDKVVKLLGREKYTINNYNLNNIGTVNSLAWTPFGGRVTQTEVVEYKGNGHVTITGNIGNTMEESVAVAMSYIKNTYKESFNNIDLHIHFLEGSIKKDGTSAGLSVTVAILSLIKKKKISKDIAFTGEISLNGDIIKIGGLKEKLIGAYNKGIKTVYIPDANKDDLEDIPKIIKEKLTIIPTVNFHEIWLELFK